MLVLMHIVIACSSLLTSTWLLIAPSKGRLYTTYGLVAATILSGSYLVWKLHAPILQTCVTGLFYLGLVTVGIIVGQRKLARQTTDG
jgi:hypothetical protein